MSDQFNDRPDMHILRALQKLSRAFQAKMTEPELDVYLEYLSKKRITIVEMDRAVSTLLDTWGYKRVPPPSRILNAARPPTVNAPREANDDSPLAMMDREHGVHIAWMCEYRKRGNLDGERRAERAVRKLEADTNAYLAARNLPPKYSNGAEVFTGAI